MLEDLIDELVDTISDLYWTDERKGKYGEKLTERKLKLVNVFGRKGKILKNVYIPKENGETSEIDLVYITEKGIFVLESKNYSGWIFGDFKSQYWTASLPNGDKNKFYNPIKQNYTHVKWLTKYMAGYTAAEIPMYSIIVFSERCELKKVPYDSQNIVICKRDDLYWRIREIWDSRPNVLTDYDIDVTYKILVGLTNVSEAQKQVHIDNIKNKIEKSAPSAPIIKEESVAAEVLPAEAPQSTSEMPICPRCGSPLVLRTAKKGANAGNRFYGCSSFPKCRYIQNI